LKQIPNMGPSESELLRVCMPPHEYARNKSKLGSISPELDSFSYKYGFGTGNDNDPTPCPHTTQKRVEAGTNHGGVGRGETSNYAFRRRGHVHDENRTPRYNHRLPYPSRGHPTNLPHPSLNIATNRNGPHIRHRK